VTSPTAIRFVQYDAAGEDVIEVGHVLFYDAGTCRTAVTRIKERYAFDARGRDADCAMEVVAGYRPACSPGGYQAGHIADNVPVALADIYDAVHECIVHYVGSIRSASVDLTFIARAEGLRYKRDGDAQVLQRLDLRRARDL
jgi:hypothetical protein